MLERSPRPGTKPRPMDALAASLTGSPELYPHRHNLRTDTVTLVRLTQADYEWASFLDERALRPQTMARTVPFAQLIQSVEGGPFAERCDFIFHIGHVGSTLVSRLLDANPNIFSLREPLVLRALAELELEPERFPAIAYQSEFARRESVFLKLLSRTFAPEQMALIKATSFVSELASSILARPSQPRAILLGVEPQSYMATILGGANARQEAKRLAPGRTTRLARRLGREAPTPASEGEMLALAWATEMSALVLANKAAGERARICDFDAFLASPEETLTALFRHLGCTVTYEAVAQIVAGPLMQRYSKDPEHAYSPALRREIVDAAAKLHGAEIADGMALLETLAREFPVIAECLSALSYRQAID